MTRLASLQARNINVVDTSDTGTGKTYTACAVLALLDKPTLAVVPKSAIHGWKKAADHFGIEIDVLNYDMIRTGRTPYGTWQKPLPKERAVRHKCRNCQCFIDQDSDPCHAVATGEHDTEERVVLHDYGKFLWHPGIHTIIFDEVHRCAAMRSLNARMLIAARREHKRIMALSATAGSTPLHFRALGYVLGLHTLTSKGSRSMFSNETTGLSFEDWGRRYGCKHTSWAGYTWLVSNADRQREIMANIHRTIIPSRGVRVRVQDIPGFPTRSIHCKLYDIDAADKVNKLYEQMADSLAKLEERKVDDKDPDNPMTVILRARQEIELLKVPVFVEQALDFVAKGCSVALFVNFKETIEALAARLKCYHIIDGDTKRIKHRQEYIEDFEADRARVILVNVAAGNEAIGLRDLRGEFPRVALVSPTFSARVMRQLFGRLPRDGSKSHSTYYVIFGADTIEEDICQSAGEKMDNVDALNDADLQPKNLIEARSIHRANQRAKKISKKLAGQNQKERQ